MPNLEIIIRYCSVLRHEIKQHEMVLRIQKGNTRNWFKIFFLKTHCDLFHLRVNVCFTFFVIVSASILFLSPTIYYSVVLIP